MKKFTQEIKDKWLEDLKSGKYKQGFNTFNSNGTHCCIAVLEEQSKYLGECWDILGGINHRVVGDLVELNDDPKYIETGKTDYSNVIPMIESLPVQE